MAIRVTQKFYKMFTSSPRAFSSRSFVSGPSAHISSSSFSRVGSSNSSSSSSSSFRGSLATSAGSGRLWQGCCRGITVVMVNQSLLSPLKLEVDPNTQAVCTQEKEQIKSLNKFTSFTDNLHFLKQPNKMLETKWSLLQQQQTLRSNIDNMFESCSNNLRRQLEALGQEKAGGADLGNMHGLVEDFEMSQGRRHTMCPHCELVEWWSCLLHDSNFAQ